MTRLEICPNLGKVNLGKRLNCLQFNNDLIPHNQVEPIAAYFHPFEMNLDHSLSFIAQCTITQCHAHCILICGLWKARPNCLVNRQGSTDNLG